MKDIVVNIYLLLGTVQDLRKKTITNYYLWAGAIIGTIIRVMDYESGNKKIGEWMLACIPGVVILLLAIITKEKIGFGDGWLIVVLGNFMSILEIILLLQIAMSFTFLFAVIVLYRRMASKTYQIPFLPFLWLAHLLIWRLGYV